MSEHKETQDLVLTSNQTEIMKSGAINSFVTRGGTKVAVILKHQSLPLSFGIFVIDTRENTHSCQLWETTLITVERAVENLIRDGYSYISGIEGPLVGEAKDWLTKQYGSLVANEKMFITIPEAVHLFMTPRTNELSKRCQWTVDDMEFTLLGEAESDLVESDLRVNDHWNGFGTFFVHLEKKRISHIGCTTGCGIVWSAGVYDYVQKKNMKPIVGKFHDSNQACIILCRELLEQGYHYVSGINAVPSRFEKLISDSRKRIYGGKYMSDKRVFLTRCWKKIGDEWMKESKTNG